MSGLIYLMRQLIAGEINQWVIYCWIMILTVFVNYIWDFHEIKYNFYAITLLHFPYCIWRIVSCTKDQERRYLLFYEMSCIFVFKWVPNINQVFQIKSIYSFSKLPLHVKLSDSNVVTLKRIMEFKTDKDNYVPLLKST